MKRTLARTCIAALALSAGAACAQPGPGQMGPGMMGGSGPGYGTGPGTMGGYGPGYGMGPGMMGGYGPGYGMGPGMMGGYGPGYGMGPGMMGGYGPGYGMGPGMMGGYGPGYGMGPGMMGGYGPGYGMGPGGRGLWALDLNESQRAGIAKIQDENRRRHWELMGRMHDEMARMRDAFTGGKRDRAAVAAALDRLHELRKQSVEQSFDAAERIEKLLTPEQREQLRKWSPAWMMGD